MFLIDDVWFDFKMKNLETLQTCCRCTKSGIRISHSDQGVFILCCDKIQHCLFRYITIIDVLMRWVNYRMIRKLMWLYFCDCCQFKRLLNKELSHFAESSKAGNQVSEYITSTFLGRLVFDNFSVVGGIVASCIAAYWRDTQHYCSSNDSLAFATRVKFVDFRISL